MTFTPLLHVPGLLRRPYKVVRTIALFSTLLLASFAHGQLAGYSYQQDISIDHTRVSGTSDLTNFPLLVNITETYLRSTANGGEVTSANGYDIAFTVDGTTQLDHDLESYDPTTGNYVAWVRIPTLYHDRYTTLLMSYGNSSVTTDPSSTGTWSGDYTGVWHLDENVTDEASGGTHNDATINGNNGTQNGNVEATGQYDDGQDFDGVNNATGDYINAGTSPGGSNNLTVSFWMKTDVDNTYQRVLGKLALDAPSDPETDHGWSFLLRPAGEVGFNRGMIFRIGDGTDYGGWTNEVSAENVYTASTWVHITGTFSYNGSNGGTGTLYVNGTSVASRANTDGRTVANTADPVYFGWDGEAQGYGCNCEFFDGILDEVRISNVAKSADWIATEYNNQSDPSTFYTVGGRPTGPGGVGTTDGEGDLTMWLDANNIVGLDDGDNLTGWSDVSGYGNNASVGAAPNYTTSWGGNGFPAVHFDDNNNEYLTVTGNTQVKPSGALSVFIAGNYDSNSDEFGSLINTASNDNWDDGWGIGSEFDPALMLYYFTDWAGTGWGSYSTSIDNQRHIYGLINSGTSNTLFEDDNTATFTGGISYTDPGDPLLLGAGPNNTGAAYFMTGEIAEVALFDTNVNSAQRIIINNYLAAKYNITLPATSDAYDEDDLGFDYDVAGIGRVNASNIHNDAQGTGIVRILNASDLQNNEFMIWGHDNGPMSIETSDLPAGIAAKLERTWAVSEIRVTTGATRDVGTVQVRFDLTDMGSVTASDLRLVVDTDGDGVFADDATTVGGAIYVSGNVYEFSGVTQLSNNSRFTIATTDYSTTPLETSPGNAPLGLTLWLKADEGLKLNGVEVNSGAFDTWENSTDNAAFTEISVDTGAPILDADGLSYNPAIYFDGVDDKVQKNNVTGGDLFSDQDNTIIAVFQRKAPNGTDVYGGWRSTGNTRRMGYIEGNANGTLRADVWTDDFSGTTDHTDQNVLMTIQSNATETRMIINGAEENSITPTMDAITGLNGDLALGCNGEVVPYVETLFGEYIVYSSSLSDTELNRIQSSLALKYSITLDPGNGDYYASDGTKIWDATVGASYQNQIVAIGRDDNTELYLKQSRNEDDSLIVYVDALAASNESNAGSINTDRSFIIIGHNTERLQATGAATDMPSGITSRFDREWKVTNHNFSDTYSIEFEWEENGPFDINDVRLLVDDDGDFSNATVLGPGDGLTFTVGSIVVGGITASHIPEDQTSYITLGSVSLGTTLPIELIEFRAEGQESDHTVKLSWSTEAETDNDYFTVEKSQDASEWVEVLQSPGAGSSSERIDYTGIDTDPYYGLSYYRLKQTDFDGSHSYSYTIPVTLGNQNGEKLSLYPNPATRQIVISGAPVDVQQLRAFNVSGQDVTALITIKAANQTNTYQLDISNLNPGIYTIRLADESLKFLKRR